VLLVLSNEKCRLRFFVHPDWRTFVQCDDLNYIESLLLDFSERAKSHPDALFKQLCNLGVGPILTQEAGANLDDYPSLRRLSSEFIEL
jgi:hypothetical protein